VLRAQRDAGNQAVVQALAVQRERAGSKSSAPLVRPRFGAPKGQISDEAWAKAADSKGKYRLVATQAGVEQVPGMAAGTINDVPNEKNGTPAKPGLNLAAKLDESDGHGTVRFVDDQGKLADRLPVTTSGPLPQMALIVPPDAFGRGQVAALATIRHEMEHARHLQMAIDQLDTWRKGDKKTPFWHWIHQQGIPAHIRSLILYSEKDGAKYSTELLAHIEGVVATLPFLAPQPTLAPMRGGIYPPAIGQLQKLGERSYVGGAGAVRADGIARLRDTCCSEPAQGKALLAWLDAVLDPDRGFQPADTPTDRRAMTLIRNDFGSSSAPTTGQKDLRAFLLELRSELAKPCAKRRP
jgi:hypothetical protein